MLFFVINLETSKDRLINFNKSMELNKQSYVRYNAIDGRKLKLYRNYFRKSFLNKHSISYFENLKGSIACALSHCALWNMILKLNNDKTYVIMEDDIKFDKDFKKKIEFFIDRLPNDWDVLYLGRQYLVGKLVNKYFVKGSSTEMKGFNISSHGYVLRKKGAEKLYNIVYPLSDIEQDLTLRKNMHKYNAYFLLEPIITRCKMKSTINENNIGHR